MEKTKVLSLYLFLFLFMILIISYLPIKNTQADQTVYNVDISTSPATGFLIAENLAPGDKETSILKIANNGNLDFNYSVSSRQESGDLELFNEITLSVYDSQGKLYEGSLGGLSAFPLGTIVKAESKSLTFTAELPLETGNDAQGKSTSVAFDFTAISHEEQIPTDGCFEPPFSNRNFTLHQRSTVPIKFHLRDESGNLQTSLQSNVRLEITGPGVNGGTAAYIFSVNEGTLKFHEQGEKPHYQARFSTWDYPVRTNGIYMAKVYVGETVSCQKEFTVLEQGNRSNAP